MQIFLNFNTAYACFVPVPMVEAARHNRTHVLPTSLVLLDSDNPTAIGSKDRQAVSGSAQTRSDEAVRSQMRNIPPVPHGYAFSTRQRVQQFQYFKNQLDLNAKQDDTVDLFNASIVAICKRSQEANKFDCSSFALL